MKTPTSRCKLPTDDCQPHRRSSSLPTFTLSHFQTFITRHSALCVLFSLSMLALSPRAHAQAFQTNANTNLSTNTRSVIVAGTNNTIQSNVSQGFIGGGRSNTITANNIYGFVGGGLNNTLSGDYSAILGGFSNAVSGRYTFVAGGSRNSASGLYVAAIGGFSNTASGTYSFIGGGAFNVASSSNAIILGGVLNSASGTYANVLGGLRNSAVGDYSAIIGGQTNSASAAYALALGGLSNRATATGATAAGMQARASHAGAFVWAAYNTNAAPFASTSTNQFLIRAEGGVGINTNVTGANALAVRGAAFIDGNLNVTGTINGTFANPTFTTLTVNGPITSSSNSISLQPGGTTGFTVGPQASATNVYTDDSDPSNPVTETYVGTGHNVIAGFSGNFVAPGIIGATISGGGRLVVTSSDTNQPPITNFNRVLDNFGAIGGGSGNTADGLFAAIAGGMGNTANGFASFIGAGLSNSIQTPDFNPVALEISTIGGGEGNIIWNAPGGTVAGGSYNTITNTGLFTNESDYIPTLSTIGGGGINMISDSYAAVIGGGAGNVIDKVQNAVIAGGAYNRVNTNEYEISFAVIGGGYQNVASGDYATIPGGINNEAGGMGSFAAGISAKAQHMGTFVWADYLPVPEPPSQPEGPVSFSQPGQAQDNSFTSTGDNQFLIRAQGGVGINTNNPGTNALSVSGRTLITGDLEVTGDIIGNVAITNASFNSVSASNSFTIQTGGTTGFTVTPQTNEAVFNLLSRNIVGGYAGNSASAGVVGATIAGGGALDGTNNFRNFVAGSFGAVSGGLNNEARSFAVVSGGEGNNAIGGYSAILGGFYNQATGAYSAILGGGGNQAGGDYSFAAGRQAKATNHGAFVWADSQAADFSSTSTNQFLIRASGGVGINTTNPGTNALLVNGSVRVSTNLLVDSRLGIGTNNPGTNALLVSGATRVTGSLRVDGGIVSGSNNSTTGTGSVTGGGVNNTNSGTQSTIAGGGGNSVYSGAIAAVVGGGRSNSVISNAALAATVAGGEANLSQGSHTFVGGGFNNQTTAAYAVVSGGQVNRAGGTNGLGTHASVGGGHDNEADGSYSTVPGGMSNQATGIGSFAAGVRAKANDPYSFVWGGDPTVDTASFGAGTYTARAPQGVRFITSSAVENDLTTNNTNPPLGVYLAAGETSWKTLSDSNAKTAVTPIDHRETLRKVAALPVTAWNYKHDPNRRYIGPMAQDFHAAFGLGADDKHISTLDTDGVTLSAIKGLVEEIEEQDAALAERDRQIEALQTQIEAIRTQAGL